MPITHVMSHYHPRAASAHQSTPNPTEIPAPFAPLDSASSSGASVAAAGVEPTAGVDVAPKGEKTKTPPMAMRGVSDWKRGDCGSAAAEAIDVITRSPTVVPSPTSIATTWAPAVLVVRTATLSSSTDCDRKAGRECPCGSPNLETQVV